jgi:ABC-2 type transport system ATP-binding protein
MNSIQKAQPAFLKMGVPAISFSNVTKTYLAKKGDSFTALKNFSLDIAEGDFFGLLGHNGAGKTTAINLLCGVNRKTSGSVKIFGQEFSENEKECKRMIGVVPQEIVADSFFKLPLMLKIQSKLSGVHPDSEWIDYLLERLVLKDHVKKTTRELSGGMKRRMMIARALVHKPRIVVLDEPTAGVDVDLRHSMWNFVQELHASGVTILLTTHYLEEAEKFCKNLAIVRKGELVTLKTNAELLNLGSRPKIVAKVLRPEAFTHEFMQTEIKSVSSEMLVKDQVFKETDLSSTKDSESESSFSVAYDERSLESFQLASTHLLEVCRKLQVAAGAEFKVQQISTMRADLEEVFLKLAY